MLQQVRMKEQVPSSQNDTDAELAAHNLFDVLSEHREDLVAGLESKGLISTRALFTDADWNRCVADFASEEHFHRVSETLMSLLGVNVMFLARTNVVVDLCLFLPDDRRSNVLLSHPSAPTVPSSTWPAVLRFGFSSMLLVVIFSVLVDCLGGMNVLEEWLDIGRQSLRRRGMFV